MEERRYKPEDLDHTGRPYEDAIPIGGLTIPTVPPKAPVKFSSRVTAAPHQSQWPAIPKSGDTIYVKVPQDSGIRPGTISHVNELSGTIQFSPDLILFTPVQIKIGYLHFNKAEWNKGYTFSVTP